MDKLKQIVVGAFTLGMATLEAAVVWQIGTKDGTGNEFALAPSGFENFIARDFGWEDRFFLVGFSDPRKDFAYVMPGPVDPWAGRVGGAGVWTHPCFVLFDLATKGADAGWRLVIDLADVHPKLPPILKVVVNGKRHSFPLAAGTGGSETVRKGDFSKARVQSIVVPLDAADLRVGANEIRICAVEGSWVIFDDMRLEGPADAQVVTAHPNAFIRSVAPGARLINGAQPLVVDVEHLRGTPEIQVELEGRTILVQQVEAGAYALEAPMPAVTARTESRYRVLVDGRVVRAGTVVRTPQVDAGVAGYVDTRMGTSHSRWMLAPGPWTPFSMVKLSPDNQRDGWQCGYDNAIESVGCFSHVHEWTMVGLGTMPVTGPLKTRMGLPGEREGHADGYRSFIDKSTEVCAAGYYAVTLTDYDIRAELTQTDRCGFQRYTYPANVTPRVMLDCKIPSEYAYRLLDCEVRQTGPRRVEGRAHHHTCRIYRKSWQDYTFHFIAEFDRDIVAFGGTNGLYHVTFAPAKERTAVQMRTAISYVDGVGAAKNLETEIAKPFGWNFEAVRAANVKTWNDLLGRVKIKTHDAREKKRFYTSLYRSFCRNGYDDVDGRWMGPLGRVERLDVPDARALGCDAFWNTFWNLNQVWNLVAPDWSARWVKSEMALYRAGGWLAKGPAGMKYIPVMVAEHEIPLMVGAWQMGIHAADPQEQLKAFVKMQTTPAQKVGLGHAGNDALETYLRLHYVPTGIKDAPFSNTMEYSYDDWTVSQFAQSIGATDVAKTFAARGTWWKNAVNRADGYCHLRDANGQWSKSFNPFSFGGYTEGNAWQLTFFVPQDVPALIDWIGKERFLSRLEWGFEKSLPFRFNSPNNNYAKFPVVQGNQQSMHFAFLFNWAGKPWLTQKWSRAILARYYGSGEANAWLGDEDQGQMSAWFVMASLGLFQTDGGCRVNPVYEIASPLYEEAVIDLGGRFGRGKTFTIKARNASRRNQYVQRAKLNGNPINTFMIPAKSILAGGTLELEMGPEPNLSWGVGR